MKRNISYVAISISLIAVVGKLFGFLREILMAKFYGTSNIVDIYIMSITIPTILFGFLPALAVGYTPVFYQIKSDKEKRKFTNNMMCISFVISFICIIFTCFFNSNIVSLIANGFNKNDLTLTSKFLNITIWLILFNTPIQLLISFLNCNEMYIYSNITNLILSLIQSLFVVLSGKLGIIFLPLGILISYVLQFILLLLFSLKKGYKFKFILSINERLKRVLILTIPIFLSNILVDLNGFIDKFLASSLYEGSISSLNYAFTLRSVFFLVCTSTIGTIFYPKISELISKGNKQEVIILITKITNLLLILLIPLTFGVILLSPSIINIVLMRGNFNTKSLNLTIWPFIMYMFSLTVIVIRDLIIKVFYAMEDSKSNLLFGVISLIVNIIFSLTFIKSLGHTGLALGTTISAILTFPFYFIKLDKIIKGLDYKKIIKNIFKIIFCCIPMIIFILIYNYGINKLFTDISKIKTFILIVLEIIISAGIYLSVLKKMQMDNSSIIFDFVNRLIKR